jgi:hypothetical protein
MGNLTIILDKSSFQSLNYEELSLLSNYYLHVITPVLTLEILGDLTKEAKEGKTPPVERVKDFANKLFPVETIVNLHYKLLAKGDLLGGKVVTDGRPNVGVNKAVESETGQRGIYLQESEEEKSIYKWKDGRFTEADQELSTLWRMTTTQENLLENLKRSLTQIQSPSFSSFFELRNFVNGFLEIHAIQLSLLMALFQNYDLDPATGLQIIQRWNLAGKPLIKDFAPYSYHCLKVDCLFLYGLTSGLITTRSTNRVDLEYLYYLPFCKIFTSNDKIHNDLVPLVIFPYQKFIIGTDLKSDLKRLVEHLDSLSLEERRKFKNEPPLLEDSLTFKLWQEFYGYPQTSNMNRHVSPEEKAYMKKKMEEFEKATHGDAIELGNEESPEFIVKESFLSKNDPCFCGSGKRVIDCCIPEEEFNRIAIEYMRNRVKNEKK